MCATIKIGGPMVFVEFLRKEDGARVHYVADDQESAKIYVGSQQQDLGPSLAFENIARERYADKNCVGFQPQDVGPHIVSEEAVRKLYSDKWVDKAIEDIDEIRKMCSFVGIKTPTIH